MVRLGCDEPPNDPHSDPALVQHFSADHPAGKAESRKALGRTLSLSLGQRSLLCVTPPLEGPGRRRCCPPWASWPGWRWVVVVRAGSDRALNERAKVLAIENPGKIALVSAGRDSLERELLAATDAALFMDAHDLTGRSAGLALRYGALPIAPDGGAFGDFLVDYDPASATGTALLYAPGDAFELVGALRRGLALRTDGPSLDVDGERSHAQRPPLVHGGRDPGFAGRDPDRPARPCRRNGRDDANRRPSPLLSVGRIDRSLGYLGRISSVMRTPS